MAYQNSLTKAIKDKDCKDLVRQIKTRDDCIKRLEFKVEQNGKVQLEKQLTASRELKVAKDEIIFLKMERAELKQSVLRADEKGERLERGVKIRDKQLEEKTNFLATVEQEKAHQKQTIDSLELTTNVAEERSKRIAQDYESILSQTMTVVTKCDVFLRKIFPDKDVEQDYCTLLASLEFLRLNLQRFGPAAK